MSFASRAFSTRRNKPEMEISAPMYVGRAASQRSGKPVVRTQISSPMALVSTSNTQLYNAPSIAGTTPVEIRKTSSTSTSTDSSSSDESDASSSSLLSAGALTDASSVDDSPISPLSEPSHIISPFKPSTVTVSRSATQSQTSSPSRTDARDLSTRPKPPERAHTAHEDVPRKRSHLRPLSPRLAETARSSFDIISGVSATKPAPYKSPVSPLTPQDMVRSSFDIFGPAVKKRQPALAPTQEEPVILESPTEETPFGSELAQLEQVAQDYGNGKTVRTPEEDADILYMESNHLAAFSAAEYMFEIQVLIHRMFADEPPAYTNLGAFF